MPRLIWTEEDERFLERLSEMFREDFTDQLRAFRLMIGPAETDRLRKALEAHLTVATRLHSAREALALYAEEHGGFESAALLRRETSDAFTDAVTVSVPHAALMEITHDHEPPDEIVREYEQAENAILESYRSSDAPIESFLKQIDLLEEKHPDPLGPIRVFLDREFYPWVERRLLQGETADA